jgi:hypothetical protein
MHKNIRMHVPFSVNIFIDPFQLPAKMAPNFRGLEPGESMADLPADRSGTRYLVSYVVIYT